MFMVYAFTFVRISVIAILLFGTLSALLKRA